MSSRNRCHPSVRRTTCPRCTGGLTLVETLAVFVILGFLSTLILQAAGFFAARYESVQRVHRVATLESLQQNWFATSVRGLVPYGVRARRFQGRPTHFEGTTLEPLHAQAGTPVTVRWSIEEDVVRYSESLAPTVPGIEWSIRPPDTSGRSRSRLQGDAHDFRPTGDGAMRSRSRGDTRRSRGDTRDFGRLGDTGMRSRFPAPGRPEGRRGDLAFHYADAFAHWYDHWPPRPDAKPLAGPGPAADTSGSRSIDALANTISAAQVRVSDPTNDWTPHLVRLVSAAAGTVWLARVEPSARPLLTDADFQ